MERPSAANLQGELLNDILWDVCPIGDWPGRDLVDLDNLGDPTAWLRTVLAAPIAEWLIDDAGQSDAEVTALLAEEYVIEIRAQGYPVPSDFAGGPEPDLKDDLAMISAEFRAFICEWRNVVTARIG